VDHSVINDLLPAIGKFEARRRVPDALRMPVHHALKIAMNRQPAVTGWNRRNDLQAFHLHEPCQLKFLPGNAC
jgi:hypothetical protein